MARHAEYYHHFCMLLPFFQISSEQMFWFFIFPFLAFRLPLFAPLFLRPRVRPTPRMASLHAFILMLSMPRSATLMLSRWRGIFLFQHAYVIEGDDDYLRCFTRFSSFFTINRFFRLLLSSSSLPRWFSSMAIDTFCDMRARHDATAFLLFLL